MVMENANRLEDSSEDAIDLQPIWRAIWKRKWSIIALSLIAILFATLIVDRMTPIYRASVRVLFEAQKPDIVELKAYNEVSSSKSYLLTQSQVIISRSLAEKVVKKLRLIHHPMFDSRQQKEDTGFSFRATIKKWLLSNPDTIILPPSPEELEAIIFKQTVDFLLGSIKTKKVENTQLIEVSVTMPNNPDLAALVVNTWVREYVLSMSVDRRFVQLDAKSNISARLNELKQELEQSQLALHQYKEKNGWVTDSSLNSLERNQLTESHRLFLSLQSKRREIEIVLNQAKLLKKMNGWRGQMTLSSIINDSVVRNYQSEELKAQAKIQDLNKRYADKHPEMVSARLSLAAATQNLKQQVELLIAGIDREHRLALLSEKELEAEVRKDKAAIQKLQKGEFQLDMLKAKLATSQSLYDSFLEGLKKMDLSSDNIEYEIKMVDEALPPQSPFLPRKKLIVTVTAFLSLLVSSLLALLLDILDNRVRRITDVEEKMQLPLLGFLPIFKEKDRKKTSHLALNKDDTGVTESLATLRTSAVLAMSEHNYKKILVTSSIPDEGKSTVAANLALSLSQVEKVLLVNLDMRRPSLDSSFDLPVGTLGSVNLLSDTASIEDCIHKIDDTDLDILPAGITPPNPSALLLGSALSNIIQDLSANYDRIIIDSPPVEVVTDPLAISTVTDAFIYVINANKTPISVAQRGVGRLLQNNAALLGVIVNRANKEAMLHYGNYYYGSKYYYGNSNKTAKPATV